MGKWNRLKVDSFFSHNDRILMNNYFLSHFWILLIIIDRQAKGVQVYTVQVRHDNGLYNLNGIIMGNYDHVIAEAKG